MLLGFALSMYFKNTRQRLFKPEAECMVVSSDNCPGRSLDALVLFCNCIVVVQFCLAAAIIHLWCYNDVSYYNGTSRYNAIAHILRVLCCKFELLQ